MTFEQITDQIEELIADNDNEDVSELDVRTCLHSILAYAKAKAWERIEVRMEAQASYESESLYNLQKSQLMIINDGTVISTSEAWQDFENGYQADVGGNTGRVNFLGPISGVLEILIRPI